MSKFGAHELIYKGVLAVVCPLKMAGYNGVTLLIGSRNGSRSFCEPKNTKILGNKLSVSGLYKIISRDKIDNNFQVVRPFSRLLLLFTPYSV